MKVARILLGLLSLVAAPILLVQGLANARVVPQAIGLNGFWQADVARAFLAAEEIDGQLMLSVDERGVELARAAYRSEPFASDALLVFAVDRRSVEDQATMRQLIDLGLAMNKRSQRLGVLELEQAALSGDFDQVLASLERLSTTNPRLRADFVRPLAGALDSENVVAELREALEREPQWAEFFWNTLPQTPDGISRFYDLRQVVDYGATRESDARLLGALVRLNKYEEAFSLWDRLAFVPEAAPTAFLSEARYAPIGWRAVSTGDRSFSNETEGSFSIFVERNTSGELARQLVRLEPGTYEFSARISPASESGNVQSSLECGGGAEGEAARLELDEDVRWQIGSDCRYYWLILRGSAWGDSRDLRASISDMTFERVD